MDWPTGGGAGAASLKPSEGAGTVFLKDPALARAVQGSLDIECSETAQTENNTHFDSASRSERRTRKGKKGVIKKVLMEMGGKEKILNIAKYQVSDMSSAETKQSKCGHSDAGSTRLKHHAYLSNRVAVVEEGGRPATGRTDFFHHLERVEMLRCYWELKHVQREGLGQLREKECKEKPNVCLKVLKAQKTKSPDVTGGDQDDLEKVQIFYQQNDRHSHSNSEADASDTGLLDFIQDEKNAQTEKKSDKEKLQTQKEKEVSKEEKDTVIDSRLNENVETNKDEGNQRTETDNDLCVPKVPSDHEVSQESNNEHMELILSAKRRVEDLEKDDLKKSRVEERTEEVEKSEEEKKHEGASEVEPEKPEDSRQKVDSGPEEYMIDCSPPPPAPFEHRVVTTKTQQIAIYYTINRQEVLGGGRFGMVHKCVENSSGLTLAAKIIKTRTQKEKLADECISVTETSLAV
ncbi:myosin light chain kinase family member 4-like isoform X3 [Clarias magur]|uniref:Myosin light chain kinase family member 4-like isoform X3 n=1 Tax=Clarias magur TaxID=1594786 RepID=A0A8J4X8J7_CLAMG|nr:myosin light chain kinase family member 4-like isoform X3 [Clarias magur]